MQMTSFNSIDSSFNHFASSQSLEPTPTNVDTGSRRVATVQSQDETRLTLDESVRMSSPKQKVLNEYKITFKDKVVTFLKAVGRYTADGLAAGAITGFGAGVMGMIFTANPSIVPVATGVGAGIGGAAGLAGGIHTGIKQVRGLTAEKKLRSMTCETRNKAESLNKKLNTMNVFTIGSLFDNVQDAFAGQFDIAKPKSQKDRIKLSTKVKESVATLEARQNRNKYEKKQLKALRKLHKYLNQQQKLHDRYVQLTPTLEKLNNDLEILLKSDETQAAS